MTASATNSATSANNVTTLQDYSNRTTNQPAPGVDAQKVVGSDQNDKIEIDRGYNNGYFSITINGKPYADANGKTQFDQKEMEGLVFDLKGGKDQVIFKDEDAAKLNLHISTSDGNTGDTVQGSSASPAPAPAANGQAAEAKAGTTVGGAKDTKVPETKPPLAPNTDGGNVEVRDLPNGQKEVLYGRSGDNQLTRRHIVNADGSLDKVEYHHPGTGKHTSTDHYNGTGNIQTIDFYDASGTQVKTTHHLQPGATTEQTSQGQDNINAITTRVDTHNPDGSTSVEYCKNGKGSGQPTVYDANGKHIGGPSPEEQQKILNGGGTGGDTNASGAPAAPAPAGTPAAPAPAGTPAAPAPAGTPAAPAPAGTPAAPAPADTPAPAPSTPTSAPTTDASAPSGGTPELPKGVPPGGTWNGNVYSVANPNGRVDYEFEGGALKEARFHNRDGLVTSIDHMGIGQDGNPAVLSVDTYTNIPGPDGQNRRVLVATYEMKPGTTWEQTSKSLPDNAARTTTFKDGDPNKKQSEEALLPEGGKVRLEYNTDTGAVTKREKFNADGKLTMRVNYDANGKIISREWLATNADAEKFPDGIQVGNTWIVEKFDQFQTTGDGHVFDIYVGANSPDGVNANSWKYGWIPTGMHGGDNDKYVTNRKWPNGNDPDRELNQSWTVSPPSEGDPTLPPKSES